MLNVESRADESANYSFSVARTGINNGRQPGAAVVLMLKNDTIYNLLGIKLKKPENGEEAKRYFHYLTEVGLHLSAYNTLFETTWYGDLKWDKEKLKGKLKVETAFVPRHP